MVYTSLLPRVAIISGSILGRSRALIAVEIGTLMHDNAAATYEGFRIKERICGLSTLIQTMKD